MRKQIVCVVAVIVIAVIFSACSDDKKNNTEESLESISYELFPTTHLIEDPVAGGLVDYTDDGTLQFSLESQEASSLTKDHVIILGPSTKTPQGLLRQISSIDKTDSIYIVKTRPCPIQRAFKYLHVSLKRPVSLTASDIIWDVTPGSVLSSSPTGKYLRASGGKEFGPFSIDYYPFDGDKDPSTPEDQVHVTATMHGEFYYVFGIDYDWPDDLGDVLGGHVLPEVSVGFYLSGGAGASLSANGMAIKDFSRLDKLGHANIGSFWLGPLFFTASMDLIAELKGSAKSSFTLSAGAEASFEAGAVYSTDDGGKLVPPTPKFEPSPITARATETADFRISIGPKVKLLLYETLGPYASLKTFAELSADAERQTDKCWNVNTGIEGEVGIELALFGESLANWGDTFTLWDTTLAEGACLNDPEKETPPDISDPMFDPWSMRITDTTGSWVYEDRLNLVQTIDSHWLASGNNLKRLNKITKNGDLLYSRIFTLKNAVLPVPLSITNAIPTSDITIMALSSDPAGIMNLNNDGKHLWNKFPELVTQSARGLTSIIETSDGFVIGGAVYDDIAQNNDAWIFKIDKQGKLLWSKKIGSSDINQWITSLVHTDDGFIATGRGFSVSQHPAEQPFIIRFQENGEIIWHKKIIGCDTTDSLTISKAVISHDGDYILGGSFGSGTTKAVLIKIKPDGTLGWIYGFENDTISTLGLDVKDINQLTDGGYLLSGTIWTAASNDYLFVARTDAVGRPTWVKRLDDAEKNASAVCALSGEGGAIIAGYSGYKNKADDTYASLWISRIGVKKGALAISKLPNGVTDESVTIIKSPCVSITDATSDVDEFMVIFNEEEIVEESDSPAVDRLL